MQVGSGWTLRKQSSCSFDLQVSHPPSRLATVGLCQKDLGSPATNQACVLEEKIRQQRRRVLTSPLQNTLSLCSDPFVDACFQCFGPGSRTCQEALRKVPGPSMLVRVPHTVVTLRLGLLLCVRKLCLNLKGLRMNHSVDVCVEPQSDSS